MRRQTDKLLLLGILAVGLVYIWAAGGRMKMPDAAEAIPQDSSRAEVLVVPIQIDRDSYGIVMVDTTLQNLWIYKLEGRATVRNRLKLLAARSWEYDKLLKEFNTAEPTPKQVKRLLERLSADSLKPAQDSKLNRREKEYEELIEQGIPEETGTK